MNSVYSCVFYYDVMVYVAVWFHLYPGQEHVTNGSFKRRLLSCEQLNNFNNRVRLSDTLRPCNLRSHVTGSCGPSDVVR